MKALELRDKLISGLPPHITDTYRLYVLEEVNSTMDVYKEENSIVLALRQTNGRGRGGSSWEDEGTAIFLTIHSHNQKTLNPCYSLIVGYLIAKNFNKLLGHDSIKVKWPNDIVTTQNENTGKLAGILIESSFIGSTISCLSTGVGLNYSGEFEKNHLKGVTCPISLEKIIRENLPSYHKVCLIVIKSIFEAMNLQQSLSKEILDKWDKYCFLTGKIVKIVTAAGTLIEGEVMGISNRGGLVIESGGENEVLVGKIIEISGKQTGSK